MILQFIIRAETFSLRSGTHTSSNIQFLAHQVIPQTGQRMKISRIVCQSCHIGYTRIEVSGTYRMTYNFILLKNRFMVLTVFIQFMTVCTTSGFFHKITGHVKVFLVTRYLI